MSTSKKTSRRHTEKEYQAVLAQRDNLARDVYFAVRYLHCPGGGLIGSPYGGQLVHWLTRFRANLAAVGVELDGDLLNYVRASKADKKKLVATVPGLSAKLENARAT